MKTHGYIDTARLLQVWNREKRHTLRGDVMVNKVSNPPYSGCDQDVVS